MAQSQGYLSLGSLNNYGLLTTIALVSNIPAGTVIKVRAMDDSGSEMAFFGKLLIDGVPNFPGCALRAPRL